MKLRIRGNTVRLRLTQGEVADLVAKGRVEEITPFEPEQLVYAIRADETAATLGATFVGGRVELVAPRAEVRAWADSDRVGMEVEQGAASGSSLRILVEKDFACLKPRAGEDETDAFPNPSPSC